NIAEGNSRHSTSKETEMRLTDVARATLAELSNDFLNWLMRQEQVPWSVHSQEYIQVSAVRLEKPLYQDDVQYQSSIHILRQKHLFDTWLQSDDSIVVANCILVLCNRTSQIYLSIKAKGMLAIYATSASSEVDRQVVILKGAKDLVTDIVEQKNKRPISLEMDKPGEYQIMYPDGPINIYGIRLEKKDEPAAAAEAK
nr:hypothetical protein [Prevotella sp.]